MRAIKYLAAMALCASLLVGNGAVATAPTTTPEQEAAAAIESLPVGGEVALGNVVVARTSEGLVVNVIQREPLIYTAASIQTTATFCGSALAAALIAIGAGVLGVLAAATGPGTVLILGYGFTGAQLGMLAGVAGSYAAVLGYINRYIC